MNSLAEQPLYLKIKDYIRNGIESGRWAVGAKVPSENEMVSLFSVSRMTARRALQELTDEGVLKRTQGLGTFVAEPKPQSDLLTIRNIAEEIAERGHRYATVVHHLRAERASHEIAKSLGLVDGDTVFHSLLVHRENDKPVQLESRYVNPALAPDYLAQDFSRLTPNVYLSAAAPLTEAEHLIEAVLPDAEAQRLLLIGEHEPCLLLRRTTWSDGKVVSVARLLHPGSRYRFGSRFKTPY